MKLDTFILIVLIIKYNACSQDNLHSSSTNNYLKAAPLLQRVVNSAFSQLNHDHHSTILDTFFKAQAEAVRSRLERVNRCYRSNVKNSTEMKLFEDPVSLLVHKYLQAFYPYLEKALNSKNPSELLEKIVHNLVNSIKSVGKHVVQCLIDLDNPNFEPSKITFNHFSLKSSEEFKKILIYRPKTSLPKHSTELKKYINKQPIKQKQTTQSTKIVNGSGNSLKYARNSIDLYPRMELSDVNYSDLPAFFDYRNQSVVSNVKDQQHTPICFIFAGIGAVESSYMLLLRENGTLNPNETVHFSEMDTVNCLVAIGLYTPKTIYTGGGLPLVVFIRYSNFDETINRIGGLKLDKYAPPFTEEMDKIDSSLCDHSNHSQELIVVKGIFTLRDATMEDLKKALYKYGPLTIDFAVPESPESPFQNLAGEQNFPCNSKEVMNKTNHAMLLVGWTPTHFIIKNSWGPYWGVEGYLYLNNKYLRNCGVIGEPGEMYFPVVKKWDPSDIYVPTDDLGY